MNIETISGFASSLIDIDKTSSYIALRDGSYQRVQLKSAKGMINTQEVALLGQEALAELQKTSRAFLEKARLYQTLAQGLGSYLKRLYQHKTVFQRLLHFLGITSRPEKEIQSTIKLVKTQALLQQKIEEGWSAEKAVVDHAITSYDKICRSVLQSKRNQVITCKLFTHAVLDSSKVEIPKYRRGLKGTYARKFMLEHLRKYSEVIGPKHPYSHTVRKVLAEFEANTRISHALYLSRPRISNWTKKRNLFHPLMLDWTVQQVLNSIHGLKNRGDQFAIQGGYLTGSRGHSVQYVFNLEKNGTYKFTIVNTGAGAIRLAAPRAAVSQRQRTEDQAWSHIPKEALNAAFINILFLPRLQNGNHSMAKVERAIQKHFNHYRTVRRSTGRNHKLQGYGSCTVKSLASWLHGRMKEPLWRSFKVFYTQEELKKRPLVLKTIANERLRNEVIAESDRIYAKRIYKMGQYTLIK